MSVKVVVKVGVKYLAARIPEPGYGKKAGGLLYNVTLSHISVFSVQLLAPISAIL